MIIHALAARCCSYSGHPYTYHLTCQKALQELGANYHCYIHQEATIDPLPKNWQRWFPSLDDKCFFKIRINRLFVDAMGSTRIFFLETFVRRDLKAFALAALKYGKNTDSLWLLFRDDHILKRRRDRFETLLIFKLLKLKFGKRLICLTDSDAIGAFLSSKFQTSFTTLPIPTIDCPTTCATNNSANHLLFMGEPRAEKGTAYIYKLAQLQDPAMSAFALTCSEQLALKSDRLAIHFHPQILKHEEYLTTLAKHDIMLLPYSSYRYKRRTSGIFVETIYMGKIPLVSDGTWLSEELKKHHLHELVVDFDNPLFFTHLQQTLQNKTLYDRLAAMQQHYHQFHTTQNFKLCFSRLLHCGV